MNLTIQTLTEAHVPAVKDFNSRLTAAGVPFDLRFPEVPVSDWLPKLEQRRLYQENHRPGKWNHAWRLPTKAPGFLISRQDSSSGLLSLADVGSGDQQGVFLAFLLMLRHVQRRQPLLYSLGMAGNADTLIPRMLKAAGWKVRTLPFFFKINYPKTFLREIRTLRSSVIRKWLLDVAACTGIAPLAIRTIQRARTVRGCTGAIARRMIEFGGWADDLWNECKDRYAMIAVRDSASLNLLYPRDNERFFSYQISRRSRILGWAVLLNTQMDNKYFGNMRVGTILDCLAPPENAFHVIYLATRILEDSGVDLIISNQSEVQWCSAFTKAGFFSGPSNFSFGVTPDLGNILAPFDSVAPLVHMTRGDGEGPLHL